MGLRDLLYGLYERRLAASLPPDRVPRHVGVIIDGNRRWARQAGKPLQGGYRQGAAKSSRNYSPSTLMVLDRLMIPRISNPRWCWRSTTKSRS